MALSKIQVSSMADNTIHGRRNLIINGGMQVAQRGTSALNPNASFEFPVDRHKVYAQASGDLTTQQSTDAPVGFKNSLLVTSSAATTPSANDIYIYSYAFEGQDLFSLGLGTSSTNNFTFSFYVKSSLTGTFTGTFRNGSTVTHTYGFSYTIDSANTWEHKSITISQSDTSAITFNNDNTLGMSVSLDLGCGTTFQAASTESWLSGNDMAVTGGTQLIGTSGATWQITGVQLEVGQATPFEHASSFGETLALCQRYYTVLCEQTASGNEAILNMQAYNTTKIYGVYSLPVEMRAAPTLVQTTGTNNYVFFRADTSDNFNELKIETNPSNTRNVELFVDADLYHTQGHAGWIRSGNENTLVAVSAEL